MLSCFIKAVQSFQHRKIWGYLLASFLLAFAAFYGIFEVASNALNDSQFFENHWLEEAADFLAKAGTLILSWMLFPVFMLVIVSIFEEKVAEIVEEKEYTKLESPTPLSMGQQVKLIIRNLLWNIVFLPVYLIPVVNVMVYYSLNAYLVGNTVFRFIAARNVGAEEAKILAARNNTKVVLAGLGVTLLTSIPVLNIIAPVFAIILMVHLVGLFTRKDSL